MYTTEPCLVAPEPQGFEREYSPEDACDPSDVMTEDQVLEDSFLWSCVNRLIDASKAGTLSFEDHMRLHEAFKDVPF